MTQENGRPHTDKDEVDHSIDSRTILNHLFAKTKGIIEIRAIRRKKKPNGKPQSDVRSRFYKSPNEIPYEKYEQLNSRGYNIYFSVCTRKVEKGNKSSVFELTCIWIDIDTNKFENDREKARLHIQSVISQTGLNPTMIVDSGNGYHLYFSLKNPIPIPASEESKNLEGYIKGVADKFKGDYTHDISRVMRLPGFNNLKDPKNPKPCKILDFKPQNLFDLAEFDKYKVETKETESVDDFKIGKVPKRIPKRFLDQLEVDGKLKRTWNGQRSDLNDQSGSTYDMALACQLVGLGFSTGEIAKILSEADYPKHNSRSTGYLKRTIRKAIDTINSRRNDHYHVDENGCVYYLKKSKDGTIPVKLANFNAEIVEDLSLDNGVEISHRYKIKVNLKGRALPTIEIPSNSFAKLDWLHMLGSDLILEPGYQVRDYVRHHIQLSSSPIKTLIYCHTGWKEIDGNYVYLSNGGAIGYDNINVELSQELKRYSLPLIPERETKALKAALSFIGIGKKSITIPLFALIYLAPLTTLLTPMPNFSGFLYGETGTFKTTLAMLMLAHFGTFDSATNLPNFEDTANRLGLLAFTLKDTLMVVDDLHPSSRTTDAKEKEAVAQRLIRSFSNRADRGRLNPDSTEQPRKDPRGMLLITGEDLVSLQSTLARTCVVEVCEGDIDLTKLSKLQENSKMLPNAMTSFICWLIDNRIEVISKFTTSFYTYRQRLNNEGFHLKLREQIAFLQFALDTSLSWLVDKAVINEAQAKEMSLEGWSIFRENASMHGTRVLREDPVGRFIEILQTMIVQNKVRIDPREDTGNGVSLPGADLIGYHDEVFFYFLPQALWHSIQKYCKAEGTHFAVSRHSLYQSLRKRNFINTRGNENTVTVRIGEKSIRVLKVYREKIIQNDVGEGLDNEIAI
jgi:hypothetical protein